MVKPLEIEINITELEEFKTVAIVAMLALGALRGYADGKIDDGSSAKAAIAQIKSELAAINFELETFNSGVPGNANS